MLNNSTVAVIKCNSYDHKEVKESIARGLKLLGGIENFIDSDEKVLLKPNFLAAKDPEEAVTTHPEIFNSLVEILKENGINNLYYGDSPAAGQSKTASVKTGFEKIAKEQNVKLAEFDKGSEVAFKEDDFISKFNMANAYEQTDAIISLPKMKTHALTRLTGAVKNQFGFIYGLNKASYHALYPDLFDFSKFLIRLNKFLKPRLFIMDGVIAMEGNGPKNGTPIPMNVILLSNDPIALDTVFAHLVDLEPSYMPTVIAARELNYGTSEIENINIVGDNIDELINKSFKVERIPARHESNQLGLLKYVKNFITRRPVLDKSKCIKCGVCERHCPQDPKAIYLKDDKYPKYNYKDCIRCFCCQELCPQKAIKAKTPLIGKYFFYR